LTVAAEVSLLSSISNIMLTTLKNQFAGVSDWLPRLMKSFDPIFSVLQYLICKMRTTSVFREGYENMLILVNFSCSIFMNMTKKPEAINNVVLLAGLGMTFCG